MSDPSDVATDPRWKLIEDSSWFCICCHQQHHGMFDLVAAAPDFWDAAAKARMNIEGCSRKHGLTDDFCAINDEVFFIRTIVELPLIGAPGKRFGFGVWSSLSRENFHRYVDTFDGDEQGLLGPMFSWLSNELKGFPDTLNLKSYIHPRNGRMRPVVELEPTDNPLAVAQREGLSFDMLLDTYAANGHDRRHSQ